MTEQEKREKAIDEMYNDIFNQCLLHPKTDKCEIGDCERCEKGLLYDAGYRKEEDVRKETIKEFIGFVKNVIYNYKPTVTETDSGIKTYHYLTGNELFDIIKEKYSVDVEE